MKTELGRVVILVSDYDEAFRFYEENFGCKKFFDLTDKEGQRFLHIGFDSESVGGIWFLKTENEEQKKFIGNQNAGLPVFVLYTDSFEAQIEKLKENNVTITKGPEITDEYMSMNIKDLYGNEIVIVQLMK